MRKTIGILAHVDAGKTTVSEQLLYYAHAIRKLGRVDHMDSFMDSAETEKRRGITIFSNQAVFRFGESEYYLVDTPGHVDFSSEMERALSVLDYAILVVSAVEGVQAHTETLWRLLAEKQIPCFVFLNKCDREGADPHRVMSELIAQFGADFVCFSEHFANGTADEPLAEQLAERDETMMSLYFDGKWKEKTFGSALKRAIRERRLFPCWYGSALSGEGTAAFFDALETLTETEYHKREEEAFSAVVSQIRHEGGKRLTFLKVIRGTLKAKEWIRCMDRNGELTEEKADEIRIYSGDKFETVQEAKAGSLCAVIGPKLPIPGDGVGADCFRRDFFSRPALSAKVEFDGKYPVTEVLAACRVLEEEDPMLSVRWEENLREIHLSVMGTIQLEILEELFRERFSMEIHFGACEVLYRETIASSVYGFGHYEPLRHYAEVHLLLEAAERGSGIAFCSRCLTDDLAQQYQNLIRTHVLEKKHKGVLIGAELTDVTITLTAGKIHLKHTEGGDLREATYRAVRQGLEKAESVLLEPYYAFRIEVEQSEVGRVISDVTKRHGTVGEQSASGTRTKLCGTVPVATFYDYAKELAEFTHGKGKIALSVDSYEPCHNPEEVIARYAYEKDRDMENPSSSVFCSHGAGFPVHWTEVEKYMHLPIEKNEKGLQKT